MRIVAFNGSPKAERSNTQVIVATLLAGAAEAGAEVETVFLARHEIGHCRGCLTCWLKTPGRCVQKDDGNDLAAQFLAADVAVFATPLYVDNVSGLMKNFMDRLIPLVDPHFTMGPDGETTHVGAGHAWPALVAVANCGYPEQSHFQVLRLLFRRVCRNMGAELVGEVYRGAGGLLTIDHPLVRPIVESYLSDVRAAGRELARTGRISAATQETLERPLVPADLFIENANRTWDRMIERGRVKPAAT